MTESSIFWATTGTGDGSAGGYSAAQLFDLFRSLFTGGSANAGGVAPDYLNKLAVSGTSSPVSVATGMAVVYGVPYFNSAATTVAVATPSTNTRIDRIVLRASWSAQTVRITRIAGTEGAGTPPAMTQSAGATWDIPLATVSITTGGVITVTDAREFLQNLGDGGVSTAKIADNAITNAKMADNAINTAEIVNSAVTLAKMANLAQSTVIGRASGAGTGVPTALTPAQLITMLLAADGAGSLLDADKLDGYQAAEFALLTGATFSGSVGIGSAPSTPLHIKTATPGADVTFENSGGAGYLGAYNAAIALAVNRRISDGTFYDTGKATAELGGVAANGDSYLFFKTGATNNTNSTERMRIDKNGNVGIGTTTPTTSALLDLTSTTGALLIPRMTTTQRNALTAANGMVIYNTTDNVLQVRQGGAWVSLVSVSGLPYADEPGAWQTATLFNCSAPGAGDGIFYRLNNGMVEMYGRVYTTTAWDSTAKGICDITAGYLPREGHSAPINVKLQYISSSGAFAYLDHATGLSYGSIWVSISGGMSSGRYIYITGQWYAES